MMRKVPFIFTQKPSDVADGTFHLEIAITYDIKTGLIYFLPCESAISGTNTLIVSHAGVDYTYVLKKELLNGTLDDLDVNDIAPNRLCILRMEERSDVKYAIVVNHSFDTFANLGSLEVQGTAKFNQQPTVVIDGIEYIVMTKKEHDALAARVLALENAKVIGIVEPSVALAGKAEGTVYFRVEEEQL